MIPSVGFPVLRGADDPCMAPIVATYLIHIPNSFRQEIFGSALVCFCARYAELKGKHTLKITNPIAYIQELST